MKVAVTFEMTPQEALDLVKGTSDTIQQDIVDRVSAAMIKGTTSAYKEAVQKANPKMLDPLAWWGHQSVYGDKD